MVYRDVVTDQERAFYAARGAELIGCRFDGPADGESALKEAGDVTMRNCFMNLRYPLWHVNGAKLYECEMTELCRAALWYDRDVEIYNSKLHGIKALRECEGTRITGSDIDSTEFGWFCEGINIDDCSLRSEYPFLRSRGIEISRLKMKGKYSFQYVENMVIRDSVLDTKDAFWHSKNVTVYDSVIKGEYLAWYSENLRLVRCEIIGTQPLCYAKGLVLEDCATSGCDLAFERSEVNATVKGSILSVKNPVRGRIEADSIGEVIIDGTLDASGCEIIDRSKI